MISRRNSLDAGETDAFGEWWHQGFVFFRLDFGQVDADRLALMRLAEINSLGVGSSFGPGRGIVFRGGAIPIGLWLIRSAKPGPTVCLGVLYRCGLLNPKFSHRLSGGL